MTRPVLRIDPYITDAQDRVSPGEMERRHDAPEDASSEGLTVVVQDTGLDQTHPRIRRQTNSTEQIDFTDTGDGDDIGHGTLVTDLATRVASGADVISHRVFGTQGSTGRQPFRDSFEWALERADEIDAFVMSWGYPGTQVPEIDAYVNALGRNGIIPFSAAGNTGGDTGSPATAELCVSIGALTQSGESMTNFSSWDGDDSAGRGLTGVPDVSAIGQSVMGARAEGTSMGYVLDEETTVASGTSFSNPFTANVGLDLLRRNPTITPKQMVNILEATAANIAETHRDGHGRVDWEDAKFAVESLSESRETPDLVTGTVWTLNDGPDWIQIDEDVLEDGEYVFDADKLAEAATRRNDD